ncbi:MAG: undecaprenyldiphospho-muramoylpentapeptide beta-N-acetylglucosaminyltransferase [Lactobacillus paracasei subsp. paracasei]|uniref:undecaprenyldiphospho-muramoylpentapeptide beta-N-acetylglucosaminyltransferase n=1 Tax=Lacticaseibacillus paracasei TaxID=1597 RepID=UPI000F0B6D06|nr:undecaprenyldiphospho-muramoylpentapeptide beta-N-acetylglucosaminyltransferase [Lacticaseibacillus paracasei]MDM7526972.1 undecaprenyldiphospho-muramoylpentapeptide beta-N-acetylglucosaminyltransferase [Lacticaseibacillus paracasei]NLT81774.1 undecaprenyldiphospho-muramoylpentapeptide beta-N-acetylglucosaminyltransferase [Lacticaseibacillus paracasei subsp. paracasei]RND48844.1 N-acetylglucosamine transferase [Lacticaseibacillus paracasei]RNE06785.1 N-acetylglucosamine transferase [Lacticas
MRLVISGGGTGGHIYPALALIEALKAEGKLDDVLYVGTKRGLESRIVPATGLKFATLDLQGFKRSLSLSNFTTVRKFLGSLGKAKKLLQDFQPDIVVGTGGYVSGAILFAATRLHIPTVIHESNSVAGVTNKFLSHFVDRVAIVFPEVAKAFPANKVVVTGNPRAQQVAGLKPNDRLRDFGLDPHIRTLLAFGGSRGAPRINDAVVAALPIWAKADFQVLFATGRTHYDQIKAKLPDLPATIKVVPYIDDMPSILPDIGLLISRAGATTLAEITALGIPAVLIPSPNVTHHHQFLNAQSLTKQGAAITITEDELDNHFPRRVVTLMEDDEKRAAMAKASKKLGVPDASDQLIAVMTTLLSKRR